MAGTTGLEPATSDVTGRRSNQLNYVPAVTSTTLSLYHRRAALPSRRQGAAAAREFAPRGRLGLMAEAVEECGLARGFGGKEARVGLDAGAPEVEAVGVPAGADGEVGVGLAASMVMAGFREDFDPGGFQPQQVCGEGAQIRGGARTVVVVAAVILALAVVEQGKEEDEERIGGGGLSADQKTALGDAPPMVWSVDGTGLVEAVVEDARQQGVEIGDRRDEAHAFRLAQAPALLDLEE